MTVNHSNASNKGAHMDYTYEYIKALETRIGQLEYQMEVAQLHVMMTRISSKQLWSIQQLAMN